MDRRDFIEFIREYARKYKVNCLHDEYENGKFQACVEMIEQLEWEIKHEVNFADCND